MRCDLSALLNWGLRSYSTAPQVWGGSPDCDHTLEGSGESGVPRIRNGAPGGLHEGRATNKHGELWSAWQEAQPGKVLTGGTGAASAKQVSNNGSQYGNAWESNGQSAQRLRNGQTASPLFHGGSPLPTDLHPSQGATCTRCGSWRGELGSEPTVGQFIANLVAVFREIKRVLRDDGVLLLNIGDSYNAGTTAPRKASHNNDVGYWQAGGTMGDGRVNAVGLKPKDLVGVPWRLAFALQEDGWYLRGDYIWAKPNPMPESVTDRCTRSHEYVFHLSKRERYYWDADAVREANSPSDANIARAALGLQCRASAKDLANREGGGNGRNPNSVTPYGVGGRNKRSVWTIATQSFKESHFATFPQKLVEPCILAATSARGACAACGAPWARMVEREFVPTQDPAHPKAETKGLDQSNGWGATPRGRVAITENGWQPTCRCDCPDTIPCTVLDPFSGSGTTAMVAQHLGRRAVGIELNPDYADLSLKRFAQPSLGLEV
jgi:DNA modification methylase